MTDKKTGLLPCPFCGCHDIIIHKETDSDMPNERSFYFVSIYCKNCNCEISKNDAYAENELRNRWNNRPIENALQSKLDIAIKELEFYDNRKPLTEDW